MNGETQQEGLRELLAQVSEEMKGARSARTGLVHKDYIARWEGLIDKALGRLLAGEAPARLSESKGVCDYCHKPVVVRMGAGFSEAWHGKGDKVWHEVCSYQQEIERLNAGQRISEGQIRYATFTHAAQIAEEINCIGQHNRPRDVFKVRADIAKSIRQERDLNASLGAEREGEPVYVALHFDREQGGWPRVAGVYSTYEASEERVQQLDGGATQSLVLNKPVRFTFEEITPAATPAAAPGESDPFFLPSGAFTKEVREKVLAPSFCGKAGHFAFQQNGNSCLRCQDEFRIRATALREGIKAGLAELSGASLDNFDVEAIAAKIEKGDGA